ncbi:serine hydrolase domain-containing protein [Actinoplanes sp. NPDC026670]|uniref:serine hydrolase domain-containing protein n=1 Tax=Actinoplanes sp. NPDC026670 TaxID=3154700 RepID=UPI0033DA03F9
MTDDLLADFVRADREQSLGTYGIHVHREGRPPVEHRFRSDDRVNLYSVSKTFTAVAIGIAESEGRLTVEDRLVDHFPEVRAADGFEKVTLRHLLTMTSGSGHMWFADGRVDAADLLHEFVAEPLVAEPGTRFAYTGSGFYALGRVIARVTGANVRDYLLPRLFRPLDLHNPAWHACPLGFPFAESDLFLRTGELARFTRLILQSGEWEGRQLIPAEFVRRMATDRVDMNEGDAHTDGYGLGIWLEPGGPVRMHGAYGQIALIDRSRRAAITVTAHTEDETAQLTALHDLVLDRLS